MGTYHTSLSIKIRQYFTLAMHFCFCYLWFNCYETHTVYVKSNLKHALFMTFSFSKLYFNKCCGCSFFLENIKHDLGLDCQDRLGWVN